MVSFLKEVDITQVFNNFRQKFQINLIKDKIGIFLKEIDTSQVFNQFRKKKCFYHKKRIVSSVCLHEDCWKLECDQPFLCGDCIVDHAEKHGDSIRCNALFTNELLNELDEYEHNSNITAKLKEILEKFEQKTNEIHTEIEEWTRFQFMGLKKFIESHIKKNIQINNSSEVVKNLKQMLSKAKSDISLNHQSKEHVKSYFTQIKKIQNDLNEAINEQLIAENKDSKMEEELDFELKHMGDEIKVKVKNQVNQLMKGFTE